ncbi:MAG: 4'-phosphopantetheinyl transferase superfamily protein [Candidatus Sericytochromatia bacterium]
MGKNHIYIYSIVFDDYYETLDFFYNLLKEDEIIRSNRFYFEKDKHNFIISRGLLRFLINKYTKIDYKKINFNKNEYGKPFLDNSNLKFNISHTKDRLLLAFSNNIELGIDIEKVREISLYKDIVKRFFSENEIKDFFSLDESLYQETFFTIWSRKEAFIKAIGQGLSFGLDNFDVSVLYEKPEIKNIRYEKNSININKKWLLFNIDVPKTHKAALVLEKVDKEIDIIFNSKYLL